MINGLFDNAESVVFFRPDVSVVSVNCSYSCYWFCNAKL